MARREQRADVGGDAARQVARDRHHRFVRQARDKQLADSIFKPALEAGAEQGVDQQRRAAGRPASAARPRRPIATAPISPPRSSARPAPRPAPHPARREMPRRDIAVAAIVARPAQDQRRQRPGEALGRLGERRPGPLHQLLDAMPPSIAACSAARISSAVRIGRVMAPPLAQARRQMPPFARHGLGGRVARGLAVEQAQSRSRRSPTCATKSAPGRARQPGEHGLDLRHQRDRRGFEIVAALAANRRAGRDRSPSQRANTSAVDNGTRGLTSSTGVPDSPADRPGQARRRPLRRARQAEQAGRHVAAKRRSDRLRHGRDRSATSDVSSRSAAAASADPPPIPDATGRFLSR